MNGGSPMRVMSNPLQTPKAVPTAIPPMIAATERPPVDEKQPGRKARQADDRAGRQVDAAGDDDHRLPDGRDRGQGKGPCHAEQVVGGKEDRRQERQQRAEDDQGDEDVQLFDPGQPAERPSAAAAGSAGTPMPRSDSGEPPSPRERRRSASWCSLLPDLWLSYPVPRSAACSARSMSAAVMRSSSRIAHSADPRFVIADRTRHRPVRWHRR